MVSSNIDKNSEINYNYGLKHNIKRKSFCEHPDNSSSVYVTQKHFQLSGFDKSCCNNSSLPPLPLFSEFSPSSKNEMGNPVFISWHHQQFSLLGFLHCSSFATCKLTYWSFITNIQKLWTEPQVCGSSGVQLKTTDRRELSHWRLLTKGMENEKLPQCFGT